MAQIGLLLGCLMCGMLLEACLSQDTVASLPNVTANALYCNKQNFTEGSAFQRNLQSVFTMLAQQTPLQNYTTATNGTAVDDTVYGLCQCFNLTQSDCGQCINDIRDRFRESCTYGVGAQLFLNFTVSSPVNSTVRYTCYLRYENYNFIPASPGSPPPRSSSPPSAPPVSSKGGNRNSSKKSVIAGSLAAAAALLLIAGAFAYFKVRGDKKGAPRNQSPYEREDLDRSIEAPRPYSYGEMVAGTENFSEKNKLGTGGFGTVYKCVLGDGTVVAVKKLVEQPGKNNESFINEVSIISGIQHRNLVKLKGYCVYHQGRMLVLEYFGNGSLDQALFGVSTYLNWEARKNIILGVARGLAYLHEDSAPRIVHRDIKASNILLDEKLEAKISDFGISKFFDADNSISSTNIAGTIGYIAPEYAFRGQLTTKADVFSFGVLVLEVVSSRKCFDINKTERQELLLKWVWKLHLGDRQLEQVVDNTLDLDAIELEEARRILHIAILCTQQDPNSRPIMSIVVAMMLGYLELPALPTQAPTYFDVSSTSESTSGSSASTRNTLSTEAFLPR